MTSGESDPRYPRYHPRTPSGAVNDPCGLDRHRDECHLFYQRHACWEHSASAEGGDAVLRSWMRGS